MNIFGEIMFVYGMTFVIAMFVALIIKVLAGLVEFLPEENHGLRAVFVTAGQNLRTRWMGNKRLIHEFRNTKAGDNDELLNFYHERD